MSVTTATIKGPRAYQEDRFVCVTRHDATLLAVLDGHGGADVAELCATRLLMLNDLPVTEDDVHELVRSLAIEAVDHAAGSTLSLVIIRPDVAIVAVLGDSPVLIADVDGRLHVGPEHNVRTNLAEREAAVARGAVYADGYICNGLRNGLQISRALGDVELRDILSREPAVFTVRTPRWALVMSDGTLDPSHGATTDALIEGARRLVDVTTTTADDVLAWATARGLHDNATALLWRRER